MNINERALIALVDKLDAELDSVYMKLDTRFDESTFFLKMLMKNDIGALIFNINESDLSEKSKLECIQYIQENTP